MKLWRDGHLTANMTRMSDQPQRWSQAVVYPDMWSDPDEDPRNSAGVSPDGELATLQDFLTNYRLTLLMKCDAASRCGSTPRARSRTGSAAEKPLSSARFCTPSDLIPPSHLRHP